MQTEVTIFAVNSKDLLKNSVDRESVSVRVEVLKIWMQ
jgi:hypothetical protein